MSKHQLEIRTHTYTISFNEIQKKQPPTTNRTIAPPRMPESAACLTNAFRQKVLRNYHDHAQVTVPHDTDTDLQCCDERKGPSGGVKVPFPTKLHLMLSKVEESGLRHIVSW